MPILSPPPQPYIRKLRVEYHGISVGVSQGETGESWTWFLSKLKEQIGEPPNLCIISDRHAAIIQDCAIVFDNSFHGFCDRHLMMNCNLKGKKLRGIFWKACKAYTTEDFDKAISELRGHGPKVVRKLEEAEAPENELCDWAAAKVYDRMLKIVANGNFPDYLAVMFVLFAEFQPNQRRKSVRTNSLIQTPTREEHLSEEARLDEKRLRNGRVYLDWDDVQASEEPVTTTEGMAVEDWQPVDIHTCSKTQINPNHRNATMKLLGNILVDKIRDSNRVYKIKDIQHDMRVDWKIDISYKRAWGGRNMALHIINGSHVDSFSQLPYYCYNLKLANEGTVTHIHTDADGRFEMLYVGFGFAIRSFLRYMRPLIIIDGAHLKGNYLGTNLLAVGMDGNNQIIPLATGVSQGETGESWTWFLSKLKEQIGEPPNLCIISDRHAAIIQACATVFDNSFHGFCDRHLMMNCNLKGKKLRGIFWKACKAYTTEDFDKAISELRGHRPEVVRKLEEAGFEKWSRAYCPRSRYNYMTSNSVESINSLTRIVRRVPITMLVEYCRDLLQRWYCEKRHKYEEAPENELCDWAAAKVYDRMLKSANWTVRPIDHLKLFQVFNKLEVHQVDLVAFQCSCRKWQLSGLPCGHVCAVCRVSGLTNCNLWAKPWFKKTTLKSTYQEMVYPLKDQKKWQAPNDLQLVLPPVMIKRPAGRPKNKKRILSTNESATIPSCTRCGMEGHNRNGCNQPFPTIVRRKSVCINSLIRTPTREEHLSEKARLDEERLRNRRVYIDWDDVKASKEPVTTTEGMAVEDWQSVQGRLDLYNPCINFLSQETNDNYYQSQPECSIQRNNQQSQPESCINYHFFHLDDM
ncbi:transposase, MuDR, MULE transposase domain protein [Tanacetum coccineum]